MLVGPRIDDDDLNRIARSAPCVLAASGSSHPGVDTVVTDGHRGAELAVEHLRELGHRRIVHMDGAENASAAQRRAGYRAGMRAAGLDEIADVRVGGDDEADALSVIDELLAEPSPPTAIFAFNDLLAAGALDRLSDAGVAVPEEMSLVGFDNTFISALRHFSLTTINQPTLSMGRLAVETLIDRIDDGSRDVGGREPVRHTLEPQLVVRDTTARAPDASSV